MNTLDKIYVKYPRTYHLPWSEGVQRDDKVMSISALDDFKNKHVVVTEKMDGENCSLYKNYFHARSIDSRNHPSRNWLKGFWSQIANEIPEGWRVCGENLYAKHSIKYENLESYFYGFSVWNNDVCLSWDKTVEWFSLLGITSVPVLYDGIFDVNKIMSLWQADKSFAMEGYVVRVFEDFSYDQFKNKVGKFVRKDHVASDEHWMFNELEKNLLKI